uniref:Uncharacterized protein n=1 Tax=Nelumbo nucifera TaxID=4432 RepID=A0A822Z8R0_NELNU|nr:TPA_asm: hypothetical protein HUJ06_015276 [Nelumbo nucifera]
MQQSGLQSNTKLVSTTIRENRRNNTRHKMKKQLPFQISA